MLVGKFDSSADSTTLLLILILIKWTGFKNLQVEDNFLSYIIVPYWSVT